MANKHHLYNDTAADGANVGPSIEMTGDNLNLGVYVSAVSGTSPTLNIEIEWSPDGVNFGSTDTTADTMVQLTTTGAVAKTFAVKGPYCRLSGTVGGTATPTVTFLAVAVST